MISVWFSKKYKDAIPFDRIICITDESSSTVQSIEVHMDGKKSITVVAAEIDDFMKAYKTYIEVQEIVSLGLHTEGDEVVRPGKKGDKK